MTFNWRHFNEKQQAEYERYVKLLWQFIYEKYKELHHWNLIPFDYTECRIYVYDDFDNEDWHVEIARNKKPSYIKEEACKQGIIDNITGGYLEAKPNLTVSFEFHLFDKTGTAKITHFYKIEKKFKFKNKKEE